MEVKKLNSVRLEWGYGDLTVVLLAPTHEKKEEKETKEMPIFKGTLEALKNL
tara:strand:- start:217 stop:372 length:156 start_codon:yes stop_codon:yes gene_type:complete